MSTRFNSEFSARQVLSSPSSLSSVSHSLTPPSISYLSFRQRILFLVFTERTLEEPRWTRLMMNHGMHICSSFPLPPFINSFLFLRIYSSSLSVHLSCCPIFLLQVLFLSRPGLKPTSEWEIMVMSDGKAA